MISLGVIHTVAVARGCVVMATGNCRHVVGVKRTVAVETCSSVLPGIAVATGNCRQAVGVKPDDIAAATCSCGLVFGTKRFAGSCIP
jgi:hypothetical protein